MGWTNSATAPLQGKSPTLFLVAGAVFLVTAVNNTLIFLVEGYESTSLTIALLAVALLTAVTGVGGLYSRLAPLTPRLARISLAVTVLATLDVFVLVVWGIAETASLAPEPSPLVVISTPLLMILGFFLFGSATLRTDAYPTLVGVLLLAQGVALVALITIPILLFEGDAPIWGSALIEGVQAAILLGVGWLLRREAGAADRGGATTPDSSVS